MALRTLCFKSVCTLSSFVRCGDSLTPHGRSRCRPLALCERLDATLFPSGVMQPPLPCQCLPSLRQLWPAAFWLQSLGGLLAFIWTDLWME